MNQILSRAEILLIGYPVRHDDLEEHEASVAVHFARAIEQAVIAKLREHNEPTTYANIHNLSYENGLELDQPLFEHPAPIPEGMSVKLSKMEESNGKVTWSVFLAKSGDEMPWDWYQVYSDSIKGRAEYEADSLKHFLGLGLQPDITAYDPDPQPPMAAARSMK